MDTIGVPELLLILSTVILLFGVGRVAKIGGELGTAVREFRKGLQGDESNTKPAQPAEEKS